MKSSEVGGKSTVICSLANLTHMSHRIHIFSANMCSQNGIVAAIACRSPITAAS